mmetsp:Transcript_18120/g.41919  ORF Transcript_18120/g.41919 Transcript_18120/m.41919 type:complete len:156 (+) Transcript_18120:1407-1874(+)
MHGAATPPLLAAGGSGSSQCLQQGICGSKGWQVLMPKWRLVVLVASLQLSTKSTNTTTESGHKYCIVSLRLFVSTKPLVIETNASFVTLIQTFRQPDSEPSPEIAFLHTLASLHSASARPTWVDFVATQGQMLANYCPELTDHETSRMVSLCDSR